MKMTANLTKNEFIKFLKTTEGKQYDEDGYALTNVLTMPIQVGKNYMVIH